ncbi:16S rRNA (uracil(1498)-N(3))-methyltransferase [Lentisphaerota bacterium WC36G]|nr:16S rRNA (uracil(1498)-N(3))-methyltransferase [Lentisphaerae bacterium WC36]
MNLILFYPEEMTLESNYVCLQGRRAEHIFNVHRAQVGDVLKAGVINGKIGEARVLNVTNDKIEFSFIPKNDPPEPSNVTLIIALQRPKTLKKVLQSAVSFGVKKFIFIESWKVEKSYWQSPLLEAEKLTEQIILGLEQGVDTVFPKIEFKRRFKPFVEDELSLMVNQKFNDKSIRAIIMHPGNYSKLTDFCYESNDLKFDENILIFGPEGGFTDYEVDKIVEAGCDICSLSTRILRTEYAVMTALGNFL